MWLKLIMPIEKIAFLNMPLMYYFSHKLTEPCHWVPITHHVCFLSVLHNIDISNGRLYVL